MNLNNRGWADSPEHVWECLGNIHHWVFTILGKRIYDNQHEIIQAVCDPKISDLDVLAARGGGKSIAACMGLIKWCIENPNLQIGVFAPKEEQSTRLLDEIRKMGNGEHGILHEFLDLESNKSRLKFKNGSTLIALSAADETMTEGWHFNIVVIDEAHQISDFTVNSRIRPMLGSLPIGKMIKIGIPMGKNHFWKGCQNPSHTVIKQDWFQCDIFRDKPNNSFEYEGKEYPRDLVSRFPLSVKQTLFPNSREMHFEGEMSEFDHKVNFAMEWAEDVNAELNETDRQILTDSNHVIRFDAVASEVYYFGLDTAAGGAQLGGNRDSTALALWRKRSDGVKEKVHCYEWLDEDIPTQVNEITAIIRLYNCKFGLVDLSNWGKYIVDNLKQLGIPVDGVMFGATEPTTKKNYKNAMHDYFKIELQNLRVKYPSLKYINQHKVFKKAYNEWVNVERYYTGGLNSKISAPSGLHDDHVSADILCVYGMDFMDRFSKGWGSGVILPKPIIIPGGFGSSFFHPQFRNPPSKYL